MKNKNKFLGLILTSVILISCIFAHTFFLTSNMPITDSSQEKDGLIEPNSAQLNEFYECDPLNNLTINADPDNNETTATIGSYGAQSSFYSKSNKTDTITKFGTLEFKSDDSKTYVNETSTDVDFEVEIDHTFTDNSLELGIQDNEIYSEAKADSDFGWLDSFYLMIYNETTELNTTYIYDRDSPDGYALAINMSSPIQGNISFLFDYDNSTNEFKWTIKDHPIVAYSEYVINLSGVWKDDSQIIDCTNFDYEEEWYDDYTVSFLNITERYASIVFHIANTTYDLFEIIFTQKSDGIIMMKFTSLFEESLSLYWNQHVISIYYGSAGETMYITYYIWNIVNLLYIFIWELWVIEIKFFWTLIVVDIYVYILEIWKNFHITNILRWKIFVIAFGTWIIKVQYFYDISSFEFYEYSVYLQYSTFYYFYHVPTIILPNYLRITIPEERYSNTTFLIVIMVTDLQENPIDDATIEGTWKGISLQQGVNVTNNGDGTYDINITAILIPPGGVPIWLNLTASRNGYANGTLNTGIAVDPDTVTSDKYLPPPPPPAPGPSGDDDDDDDKEEAIISGPGLFLISVVSAITIIFVVIYINKKKGYFKRKFR